MKKLVLLVGIVAVAAFGFSSCKKCSTCTVMDGSTLIIAYPEVCGNKADIDAYEKTAEDAYSSMGYTITCE